MKKNENLGIFFFSGCAIVMVNSVWLCGCVLILEHFVVGHMNSSQLEFKMGSN